MLIGQLIKETMDKRNFSYRPMSFFYLSLTVLHKKLSGEADTLQYSRKFCRKFQLRAFIFRWVSFCTLENNVFIVHEVFSFFPSSFSLPNCFVEIGSELFNLYFSLVCKAALLMCSFDICNFSLIAKPLISKSLFR